MKERTSWHLPPLSLLLELLNTKVKCKTIEYKSLELVGCLEKNTEYTQNLIQGEIANATQADFKEDSRLEKLSQVHTWIVSHP